VEPRTAWELIGWDNGRVRIVGGRATYEAVMIRDGGDAVRLARLEVGPEGLRQLNRYVNPDTLLEPADALAEENWEEVT